MNNTLFSTIYSIIFSFVVIFILGSTTTEASSGETEDRFPFFHDVSVDHPHFIPITQLFHDGVINGYPDGTFRADKTVSRAEAIKILLEGSQKKILSPSQPPFPDTPLSEWFTPYVHTAKITGIVQGDGLTQAFIPARTVNKAEAIKMLLQINNAPISSPAQNEQWYDPYFQYAFAQGIIKDLKNPNYALTRGDLVSLLYKIQYPEYKNTSLAKTSELNPSYSTGTLSFLFSDTTPKTLVFTQKNTSKTINISSGSAIDPLFWEAFDDGIIYLWEKNIPQKKYALPVYERFHSFTHKGVEAQNITWEYDNILEISVTTSTPLINTNGYVLNSHEELFEKPVQESGHNLSLSFVPQKKDFYVLEITDEGGSALAILSLTPKGYFPILPNSWDLNQENTVLEHINTFRKKHGRTLLKENEVLTQLAKIRVTDMIQRNYLEHTTPEGETVNDLKSDFSLSLPIAENIALSQKSMMDAVYFLEYSPTHRIILLKKDIDSVGINAQKNTEGSFIVVELFQSSPASQSDLDEGSQSMTSWITEKYSVQTSSILNTVAEEWSGVMAEKQTPQVEFDDGRSWKNFLDAFDITKNSSIFVLEHQSPQKMLEYLQENSLDHIFTGKTEFGIGMYISKNGLTYLTIISTQ